jgi:hypothetical protein
MGADAPRQFADKRAPWQTGWVAVERADTAVERLEAGTLIEFGHGCGTAEYQVVSVEAGDGRFVRLELRSRHYAPGASAVLTVPRGSTYAALTYDPTRVVWL